MQGDWHRGSRASEQIRPALAHQLAQCRRDRSAPFVFQRVLDFLHAAFVMIDRAPPGNRAGEMLLLEMRGEPQRGPAVSAHRAIERSLESLLARRTGRLEER